MLISDGSHSLCLAGDVDRADEWRNLLDREIASVGQGVLKAYVTENAAETVFAGYPLRLRERVLYRGDRPAIDPAYSARRTNTDISLGANTRNGGPQNPVPRLV